MEEKRRRIGSKITYGECRIHSHFIRICIYAYPIYSIVYTYTIPTSACIYGKFHNNAMLSHIHIFLHSPSSCRIEIPHSQLTNNRRELCIVLSFGEKSKLTFSLHKQHTNGSRFQMIIDKVSDNLPPCVRFNHAKLDCMRY